MSNNLQHPDITRALNWGEEIETPMCFCDKCREGIYFGEKAYCADDGRVLCKECMENEIEELGLDYVAEALGFRAEEFR